MMKKSIVSLVLSLTLCLCLSVSASAYEMSKPGQVPTISSGQCGHTGIADTDPDFTGSRGTSSFGFYQAIG